MKHLYIPALVAAIVAGAYWAGCRVTTQKCAAQTARAAAAKQYEQFKKIGEINETVNHTATADIRRVLSARYTIAD